MLWSTTQCPPQRPTIFWSTGVFTPSRFHLLSKTSWAIVFLRIFFHSHPFSDMFIINGKSHCINKVTVCRVWLILGRVTIHGYTIWVFNQPPRPTQPGHPSVGKQEKYYTGYGYGHRWGRTESPTYQAMWPALLGLLAYWLTVGESHTYQALWPGLLAYWLTVGWKLWLLTESAIWPM